MHPFSYQEVEKGCIGNEWVKGLRFQASVYENTVKPSISSVHTVINERVGDSKSLSVSIVLYRQHTTLP